MIQMGNLGENQSLDMGSRLSLKYKVWNFMGRGRHCIWRQTEGAGGLKAERGGLRGCRLRYGSSRETIANGYGGNSTGRGSADPMLIAGLVAGCLILKALRGNIHKVMF